MKRDYTKRIKSITCQEDLEYHRKTLGCHDCGRNNGLDGFVLVPKLWNNIASKIWPANWDTAMVLCSDCIETRLGRKIRATDLGYMRDGRAIPMNIDNLYKKGYLEVLNDYIGAAKSMDVTIEFMKTRSIFRDDKLIEYLMGRVS